MCVRERVREKVCVYTCVSDSEREREMRTVEVCRLTKCVCVCVCLCVLEGECDIERMVVCV